VKPPRPKPEAPQPKRESKTEEPESKTKEREEPRREPAPPGVYREVVTDADGRILVVRGAEVTGHQAQITSPELTPVEQAREVAWEFSRDLPDYTCEQWTWRYNGNKRPIQWKRRDRVFADVVYSGGKEYYVNVKVNNKPLKRGSPFDSGTWSTGEYGTILLDVLSHTTNAKFVFEKETQFGSSRSLLFSYTVEKNNSHWRVEFEGYGIKPAYQGQVWIDPATHRVQRVEMQTRELPGDYPLNLAEMTVDYGLVRVAGRELVMPIRAENLACRRGMLSCTRNETEFRNYRKFTAKSSVMSAESTIQYEGAEDPKPKK
jgi:hypothetical protein